MIRVFRPLMEFLENLHLDEAVLRTFKELLIVLGIGLLLGTEREYSKQEKGERLFAGVRTFPIVGMGGYLSLYLADRYSYLIYVAAFAGVMVIIAMSYLRTQSKDAGTTTEFSLMMTFILGSLVFTGEYHLAVTIAVLLTTLLALKIRLHEVVHQLSLHDIYSILYFVVITALVLPLLPNEDLGPYGVLNPYKIWLIVSIFVALNFLAYFLSKFFDGKRSILITGILGGFASSTATSWYFSRQSGKSRSGGQLQAAAIILASSIMFFRLLVWLLIFNRPLFQWLWLPILIFGAVGIIAGYRISKVDPGNIDISGPQIDNPINFKEAIAFALIYVVIQLLVGFAANRYGDEGVFVAAGISGLTDIDAITISMADYGRDAGRLVTAGVAILIAAFANTLVKYVFCLVFGNARLRKYSSYAFVPMFLLGISYIIFQLRAG